MIAGTVARKLSAPPDAAVDFDIIVPMKLAAPHNKEQAIGTVMEDGTTYLDEDLISMLQISPEYLEKEKAEQLQEIRHRNTLYYINAAMNHYEHIKGKTTILVDDGAATGATLIASARWLKKPYPKTFDYCCSSSPKGYGENAKTRV